MFESKRIQAQPQPNARLFRVCPAEYKGICFGHDLDKYIVSVLLKELVTYYLRVIDYLDRDRWE